MGGLPAVAPGEVLPERGERRVHSAVAGRPWAVGPHRTRCFKALVAQRTGVVVEQLDNGVPPDVLQAGLGRDHSGRYGGGVVNGPKGTQRVHLPTVRC